MPVRQQIEVSGIVQGVGFRPFVYRLASDRQLAGAIKNTATGVVIEVQGTQADVDDFLAHLSSDAPPLARITNIVHHEIPCTSDTAFRIAGSDSGSEAHTLISPDVAVCPDCLRELFDPGNRRFRYPFINCTNCGPRFTIVRDIPYDRAATSMAVFPMCSACQAEYHDPLNRRFHAQPNACWDCGPQVQLWDKSGTRIECEDAITRAAEALKLGQIVAVKGLGGFHLAADATNAEAVGLLRQSKHRVEKPFAIMVPSIEAASEICEVSATARMALESVSRPIVLLPRLTTCELPDEIAPFNRFLGVFLPYTPLHYVLFDHGQFKALVMTSGNLSEEPIAIDNHEAVERLQSLADLFLVHNRDILLRCDDSVVRVNRQRIQQMRRSRGFVPVPVFLKDEQPSVLAVGGELKNTICLTKDKNAFLSQHVGDLENVESYRFFEEAISHLQQVLEIKPEVLAYDLHPDYFSTRWALSQKGMQSIGVQHHHAHIASCMAENHLEGQVIGIALDGTGYGTDGKIWGGEVLIAGYEGFERFAHLEYMPLPGGAAAIREPWRMAVSYLMYHFGRDFFNVPIPFVRQLDRGKAETLVRMVEQDINSPLTSSCGRLFDAVAALIGVRQKVNYEAQAAIELEMAISGDGNDAYALDLIPEGNSWVIGTRPLFDALVRDIGRDLPISTMSRRFHNGLTDALVEVAQRAREAAGLDRVCLSGGTFNNLYLCAGLESKLSIAGFEVFTQNEVSAGDGGLSLGQAMVATHWIKNVLLREKKHVSV
jgi:hydrogenase maturation protein HypF